MGKGYGGETKWMYFLIEYDELLKEHNNVWNKVKDSIKKSLIAKLIRNKHILEAKIILW